MFHVSVYCTLQFVGFHQWNDAPEHVAYLRNLHRHLFNVKVTCKVMDFDREIEFITLKGRMERSIAAIQVAQNTKGWSCEMWAREILLREPCVIQVDVNEDGENGAIVTRNQRTVFNLLK